MAERADPRLEGFKEDSIYRQRLFERYEFCNEFVTGKKVLDIPCGVGWGTSLLKGCLELHGIDVDRSAIDYARIHYPGIKFKIGEMQFIPYLDKEFDTITCLEGFEHIDENSQDKFIKEILRVLKDDGIVVITAPILNDDGTDSGNPYHLHEPSLLEFQSKFLGIFVALKTDIVKDPDARVIRFAGRKK